MIFSVYLPYFCSHYLQHSDTVVVEISHLSLIQDTEYMNDPEIKRLFIAYNFLGINPAELETPISLPKPKSARQQLEFNFRKGRRKKLIIIYVLVDLKYT